MTTGGLNPLFITSVELQSALLDKTSALQLAGGQVYFYQDINRNNLKNVYQLTGSPGNYSYTPLPNPLTLSNAGTFMDNTGNDIAVYYYPWDNNTPPKSDLYYVAVYAAGSAPPPVGTPQLTREAWPSIAAASGALTGGDISPVNMIANSQFVDVFFDPTVGMTIPYNTGNTDIQFAPGWGIRLGASGAGSVIITRNSIAGSQDYATNPPYALKINTNGGANLNSVIIYQKLTHNPNIYARQYLSAGIMLGVGTQQVQMFYAPQGTALFPALLSGVNNTGKPIYKSVTNPVALNPGGNAFTADTGYTEIQISLTPSAVTEFSSVQIMGLDQNINDIPYQQQPVIQQQNSTFFYYNSLLQAKPIPSYLIGWDFALNPAQLLGDAPPAQAIGANKSFYAWDQTIIFQEIDSGVTISRSVTTKGIKATIANADGRIAFLQYLDGYQVRELLKGNQSVYLRGFCSGTFNGTVTLWATDDTTLPDIKSPNYLSAISSLTGNGRPTMTNGTWTEIPRNNLGDAKFQLTTSSQEFTFSQWSLNGAAPAPTANYFAIVVGFESKAVGQSVTLEAIGVYNGNIATKPAPQTPDEVLSECQRYYEKSYESATTPTSITSVGALVANMGASAPGSGGANLAIAVPCPFAINFKTQKRVSTYTANIYSPITGTIDKANIYILYKGASANADTTISTQWTVSNKCTKSINYLPTAVTIASGSAATTPADATTFPSFTLTYQCEIDARLGVAL